MQPCYILADNTELWEWIESEGNEQELEEEFILNDVVAYKIDGVGYMYLHWVDDKTMSVHAALMRPAGRGRWIDMANIAYYLGAEKLAHYGGGCDTVYRIFKHFGFKDEDGILTLPLPYKEN